MQYFDLEFFMKKTLNKSITIELLSDDNLLSIIKLVINDARIQGNNCFDILTINENIQIYFEKFEINPFDSSCLSMYRNRDALINIYLPNEENWIDDRIFGFPQY